MAITNEQALAAINAAFADPKDFAATLKLWASVSARTRLEIKRDAANRAVGDLHQQMQAAQQKAQSDLSAIVAGFNQEISDKQAEAASLQQQIDAVNEQLPDALPAVLQ